MASGFVVFTGSNQAKSSKSILLFLCEPLFTFFFILFFLVYLNNGTMNQLYNNDCYKIGSRIIRQALSA